LTPLEIDSGFVAEADDDDVTELDVVIDDDDDGTEDVGVGAKTAAT
jgi:hypothetical protein